MRQANQPGPGVMFQPVSQPLMASPGPVGFQPNSPNKKVPALMGLSIVHVALGCLSTILGIVAIILKCNYSYVGWGLWSGVLFFGVTGFLGLIGATRKNNNGWVIAFMVMSIISAAVAFQLLVAATIAATGEWYGYCNPGPSYHSSESCYTQRPGRVAVDALLAVTGLAEMVIAVVSASLSCYGMCSCCRSYTPVTVQYVPQQLVPMMPVQAQQQQQQQWQQQQQLQQQQQQQLQQQQEQQQLQQQQQQQLQQQQPQQASHGFIAVNAQQQQGPSQQQPMQAPTAMQGSPIGSQYVTDYRASPTQQMANPPQQIAYVPQPVGSAAQMVIAPQPISMAPQQVVVSVPSQTAPTGPVEAGGPTAETPDAFANQAGVTNSGGSEHFHHDDKEGLLETV